MQNAFVRYLKMFLILSAIVITFLVFGLLLIVSSAILLHVTNLYFFIVYVVGALALFGWELSKRF